METKEVVQLLPYEDLIKAANEGTLFSPQDLEKIKSTAATINSRPRSVAEAEVALRILEGRFKIAALPCFFREKVNKGEPKIALKFLRRLNDDSIEDVLVYGERNDPPRDYELDTKLTRQFSARSPYIQQREVVFPKAS